MRAGDARGGNAKRLGRPARAVDLAAELATNASEACFACAIDEDTILVAEMDGRLVGYVQFGARCRLSHIVVEVELVGMRTQAHLVDFARALVV